MIQSSGTASPLSPPSATLALVAMLALAVPGVGQAAEDAQLPVLDRFRLSAGIFSANHELAGRWDSGSGRIGTPFDFQRDLGFSPRLRTPFWMLGAGLGRERQWQVDLFHFETDDDGSRTLERPFELGDDSYQAGARFTGSLDTTMSGASLSWFFHRRPASAFGVGLGVIDYRLRSQLHATITVEDRVVDVSSGFDEQAWAPMLRGEYVRRLGERWRMAAAAAYISANLDNVSGHVLDAHVRFDYFPTERLGLTLRYAHNVIDVNLHRDSYEGKVHLHSHGPQLFTTLRF